MVMSYIFIPPKSIIFILLLFNKIYLIITKDIEFTIME
jgi:hypothetical protein